MSSELATVLIFDHEVLSLQALSRILKKEFDVKTATSTAEAHRILVESSNGINGSLKARVEALETSILRETLIRHRWNKSRAAEELGLSRVGLRSKLDRYGLEPKLNS